MKKPKLQLVPNNPRKPTGKVVTVQPNDVESEMEVGFKTTPKKLKLIHDKHQKK